MKQTILFFLCVLTVWGSGITLCHAQFSADPLGGGSNLAVTPRYPEAGQLVKIELNDYSINTAGASFTWFVDGKEVTGAKNERSMTFTAGQIGDKNTVSVRTTLSGGAVVTATTVIAPVRIDLLVEADTLTPTFYAGRALPSSGSPIRVTAIPFLGDGKSPAAYSYIWHVGENVVAGGSRLGKNSVTFASGFERTVRVSVDIIDSNGKTLASKALAVPISNAELHFYEVSPLQGLIERALDKNYIFVGDEIRVRAEPYFVDRTLLAQNPLIEWKLDNQTITNPNSDPQEIILRRQGEHGSFNLEFHIRNLHQLLQGVKDSITINF